MGSKEVMVSAPLVVPLYDRVFLPTSFRDASRRRWGLYAGLAATWLILAAEVWARPSSSSAGFGFKSLTWLDYAKTQCGVVLHYLRLSFWPHPLVINYAGWPVTKTAAEVVPPAAAVLALLGATLCELRRRSWLGFLGAWFFLILAPTSSFLPIITEIAAERRMYLPLAAVVTLAVIGGHEALRVGLRRLVPHAGSRGYVEVGVLVGALAALSTVTVRRNHDYRSEIAILKDLVAKRPGNVQAHYNLGVLFDRDGQIKDAATEYAEAVRLDPHFSEAALDLGVALARQRRVPEAIDRYAEFLRSNPNDARVHNNLGVFLASQGRLEEAISHYLGALGARPNYADAHTNLANALRDQGRLDEAVAHYSEALRIAPENSGTHYNLGVALAKQGKTGAATEHLERALALDPGSQRARRALQELRTAGGQSVAPP